MKYSKSCLTKVTKAHSIVAPKWFTESKDITNARTFLKSFDTLGLRDFTAPFKMNNNSAVISKLNYIYTRLDEDGIDHDEYQTIECLAVASIRYILEKLQKNVTSSNVLMRSIKDDRNLVIFKRGTTVKHVIKDLLLRSPNIVDSYPDKSFKEVSNMLGGNEKSQKVVFSTNPWDILTMSMRGINSCMEWRSSHCQCLIGSVLDPYCAVMYVTNGQKTAYGSHMIYRSVVRLVKKKGDSPKSKFHLFVEGAYPNDGYDEDDDCGEVPTEMFRSILAKRIKNNPHIESVIRSNNSHNYYVPFTTQTKEAQYKTYFDSNVHYG